MSVPGATHPQRKWHHGVVLPDAHRRDDDHAGRLVRALEDAQKGVCGAGTDARLVEHDAAEGELRLAAWVVVSLASKVSAKDSPIEVTTTSTPVNSLARSSSFVASPWTMRTLPSLTAAETTSSLSNTSGLRSSSEMRSIEGSAKAVRRAW